MSLAAMPTVPAQFQSFLAFDFGMKRTGVAFGNRLLGTATPQPTIKARRRRNLITGTEDDSDKGSWRDVQRLPSPVDP